MAGKIDDKALGSMVERLVRNEKAAGAIPAESTITCMHPEKALYLV